MSVDVVTFGCRLNIVESEVIRREAGGRRRRQCRRRQHLRGDRRRRCGRRARRSAGLRRERPDARIVVTGCAAQTEPATFAAMPEVDRVLGNDREARPAARRGRRRMRASPSATSWRRETLAAHRIDGIEGHTRAFVQVQNGCDHRCTFCIIPYGRGNSRSLPMDEVVAQVRRLAGNGYREIVLTGVDITSYGATAGEPKLGALVKQILREVPELARLRLSSIDSVEADADLLDALANEPRLMPHLHLSLQAGDDLILKRMKRRHSRADAIALLRRRARACGPTSCSAPTSSPAFRPRPKRCSRARSISSTNAG